MKQLEIDLRNIYSWQRFHDYFAQFEGFPEYYGRNLNAWIDVMQDYYDESWLCVIIKPEPDITTEDNPYLGAILDCITFINFRKLEESSNTYIIPAYKS